MSAKGVDRLIEAVKIMGENGVDYRLLIAGEGPDKEVLEKYSKEKSSRSSSLEWLIMNKSVNCIEWQRFLYL